MTNRSWLDLSREFTGHAISMSRSNAAQGEPFGTDYTAGVRTGSREDQILANQHHTLSTYRILFDESRSAVRDRIKQLIEQECVERVGDYVVLKVTDKGRRVLKGKELPLLLEPAKERAALEPPAKGDPW
jgi:ATP-dependent DNA helicase RecQ